MTGFPYSSSALSRRAFTLIELLTVIAIVGILVAIIIPAVGTVRSNARNSQCVSNVRELAMANLLYASENKGQLIVQLNAMRGSSYIMPDLVRSAGNWHKAVAPYLGMDKVSARSRFICPDADLSGVSASQINNGEISTYTVSMFLHNSPAFGRLQAIEAPIVMVAEARVVTSDGTYPWNVNGQGVTTNDLRRELFRHAGSHRRNVAMTDGSAHSLSPIEDGIFRDGSTLMRNYCLPPGSNTSASLSIATPTDTIPR